MNSPRSARSRASLPSRGRPRAERRPGALGSTPGLLTPQHFVKLELHPHRQAVAQYPCSERSRRKIPIRRGEEYRADAIESARLQDFPCPRVIGLAAQHELDLVAIVQVRQILPAVFVRF